MQQQSTRSPRPFRLAAGALGALGAAAALAFAPSAQAADGRAMDDGRVQQAAGTSAAAIQSAVDAFRADLGGQNNGVTPGSQGAGRREINWDAVPDALAAPANLPLDQFRARGALFATPGQGVRVSANQGVAPIEFDELDRRSSARFATFSPQRLFTAVGSNVTDVRFVVPGSNTPATVSGFGAVFTDVDHLGSSRIAYYDRSNRLLARYLVPASPGSETLSFLGVNFPGERVARVRITSGNAPIGVRERRGVDVAAMDDFVYAEPSA